MNSPEPSGRSSEELATLVGDIPRRLQEAGVNLSPAVPSAIRSPDIFFTAEAVSVEQVIGTIAQAQARMVFLESTTFDSALLVEPSELEYDEVMDVIARAAARDGDLSDVRLTWAVDGLLCVWSCTAGWSDRLSDDAEEAAIRARDGQREDFELESRERVREAARLREMLLADPTFRLATVNKRTAVAKAVLAAHGENLDSVFSERLFMSALRQQASIASEHQEMLLQERADEIAAELRSREPRLSFATKAQQLAGAAQYLSSMADGWMLSSQFIDRIRRLAFDIG
ncbi:hypothetical protein [Agrococcus jenensis]|uniref:Uncharacterized protein n=1 Tax=Agrococcus jenensis TaxID=46353 RepID=A0A3N2AQK5_9MICO|nr:hypothetical protein [Agrococcus jenensis]ROR65329.1 hypothetical protein EDD26_0695 [Agrococcus jenensis]